MIKAIKFFKIIFLLNYILFFYPLLSEKKIHSFEINNYQENINKTNSEQIRSEYIIGPGDSLFLTFEGLEIYNGTYNVDPDGNLYLPELKYFKATGYTKNELKKILANKYDQFIFEPKINIQIASYRPVIIFISGEVKNPGLYKLNYLQIQNDISQVFNPFSVDNLMRENNDNYSPPRVTNIPKLFDAIKQANGVTNTADLARIKVIRKNSISQGNGQIEASIDLLSLIVNGDQSQNIRLQDGDNIIIPKSEKILKEQIIAINKTNLNPDKFIVFITGETNCKSDLQCSGSLEIKKGTSLVQAIAETGGKKLMSGKIEFIRFGSEGVNKKYVFNYDPSAKIDTYKNPILMDGDIINIQRTILGTTAEITGAFSYPILSIVGLVNIFN